MPKLMYRDSESNEFTPLSIEPLDCYPVGSFYISYESTSPAELFGGDWTAITGRFPYFNSGISVGGASSHKHVVPIFMDSPAYDRNQIRILSWRSSSYGPIWGDDGGDSSRAANMIYVNTNRSNDTVGGNNTAGNGPCMNSGTASSLPPYQTVYAWRRIA